MSTRGQLSTARILIVGDDLHLAMQLRKILSGAGCYVQHAATVDEASYLTEQSNYDLALVDLRVSGHDTQSIMEALRQHNAFGRFPWIAMMDSDVDPAVPDGAVGVILLPVRATGILGTVTETLRRLRTRPEPLPTPDIDEEDDVRQLLAQRLLEQETLSEIARFINSTLDLNQVLTKVVNAATRLTNAEEGLLLLPEDDGRTLYIRAEKGIENETARHFRVRTRDSLAGQVFEKGEPLLIRPSGWRKVKTAYYVQSLLYVPLKSRGEVIGVLGVSNRTAARDFTDHDQALLEDLASHAAIAIENAKLYGESITRAMELSTLVAASEAVNSTLSFERSLHIIVSQIRTALDVRQCDFLTWDRATDRLMLLASCCQVHWADRQGPSLSRDHISAFDQALEQKKPQLLTPYDPVSIDHLRNFRSAQSWLLPLQDEQQTVVGLLELRYLPDNQEVPAALNVDEIHDRALTLALETDPNKEEDMIRADWLAATLIQKTGAEMCSVWLLDKDTLYNQLNLGCGVWANSEEQPRLDLKQVSDLQQCLTQRQPFSTPDTSLQTIYWAKAILALPVVINDQVLGVVIMADTLNNRTFSQREIDLGQALILQAANALQNVRLFRDLQISLEELRRTQAKLVQTARLSAIGELAAAVAHQINNPLTTVLVDTQILLADKEEGDPDLESLEAVLRGGKRAHEVVRRLLAMARHSTEDVKPEAMDINETINNTLSLVHSHVQSAGAKLVVELAEQLPLANGLRGQLEDVWLNLILNARDAVSDCDKPTIGIHSYLSADKHWVCVNVWDNGMGISPDNQETIFDAFFTTKEAGKGTGLGLHICRQVVEKCAGHITVDSHSPQGALFTVSLPVRKGNKHVE